MKKFTIHYHSPFVFSIKLYHTNVFDSRTLCNKALWFSGVTQTTCKWMLQKPKELVIKFRSKRTNHPHLYLWLQCGYIWFIQLPWDSHKWYTWMNKQHWGNLRKVPELTLLLAVHFTVHVVRSYSFIVSALFYSVVC